MAVKRSKEIEEARNRLPITGEEQLIMETINNHQAYALGLLSQRYIIAGIILVFCALVRILKTGFIVLWIWIWFGFQNP